MRKSTPARRFKRRQIKKLRSNIQADLIHDFFDDANQWKFMTPIYKHYWYDNRRPNPKSNIRNKSTQIRLAVRKFRALKSKS